MAQLREMRRSGGEKVKEDLIFDDVLFAQIYTRRRRRLTRASLTHACIYLFFIFWLCLQTSSGVARLSYVDSL